MQPQDNNGESRTNPNLFNLWQVYAYYHSYSSIDLYYTIKKNDLFSHSGLNHYLHTLRGVSYENSMLSLMVADILGVDKGKGKGNSRILPFFGIPTLKSATAFEWIVFVLSVLTVIPELVTIIKGLVKFIEYGLFCLRHKCLEDINWNLQDKNNPKIEWTNFWLQNFFDSTLVCCYYLVAFFESMLSWITSPIKNCRDLWNSKPFGSEITGKVFAVFFTLLAIAAIAAICIFAPHLLIGVLGSLGGIWSGFAALGTFLFNAITWVSGLVSGVVSSIIPGFISFVAGFGELYAALVTITFGITAPVAALYTVGLLADEYFAARRLKPSNPTPAAATVTNDGVKVVPEYAVDQENTYTYEKYAENNFLNGNGVGNPEITTLSNANTNFRFGQPVLSNTNTRIERTYSTDDYDTPADMHSCDSQ